jgi:hypothetical protein
MWLSIKFRLSRFIYIGIPQTNILNIGEQS